MLSQDDCGRGLARRESSSRNGLGHLGFRVVLELSYFACQGLAVFRVNSFGLLGVFMVVCVLGDLFL